MIWVLAGTIDAREIIRRLKAEGFDAVASAITERGKRLAKKAGADYVAGAMDEDKMVEFLRVKMIRAAVDATHPYAVDASLNAMRACSKLKVPYLRFERPPVEARGDHIHLVEDFQEAGRKAAELGDVIFYAAGSRNIGAFLGACKGKRVVARVLRDEEVVEECLRLGLRSEDIIADIPPYSKEDNLAMFRQYGADVLVTKESGIAGGMLDKLEAAHELGIQVVVVRRPAVDYPETVDDYGEAVEWVKMVAKQSV